MIDSIFILLRVLGGKKKKERGDCFLFLGGGPFFFWYNEDIARDSITQDRKGKRSKNNTIQYTPSMDRGKLSALYSQTRPSTSHRQYQDVKKVGDRYDEKVNDALHEKGKAWQNNGDGLDEEEKELRGFDMDTRYEGFFFIKLCVSVCVRARKIGYLTPVRNFCFSSTVFFRKQAQTKKKMIALQIWTIVWLVPN